jgi:hypothetical protein
VSKKEGVFAQAGATPPPPPPRMQRVVTQRFGFSPKKIIFGKIEE